MEPGPKESLAIDSHVSSRGFIPSALANREEVKAIRRTIQRLKGFAKYLDVSMLVFGKQGFVIVEGC